MLRGFAQHDEVTGPKHRAIVLDHPAVEDEERLVTGVLVGLRHGAGLHAVDVKAGSFGECLIELDETLERKGLAVDDEGFEGGGVLDVDDDAVGGGGGFHKVARYEGYEGSRFA